MVDDVVVIGGGVIGLSIAYRLSQDGASVTLLDRRELGREASWAGAGLIPAHCERVRSNPSSDLRSWSATLFPDWSEQLRVETGIDNGYRRTGGVDVALSDAEATELKAMAGRWRVEGIEFEHLAEADISRVEPALRPNLHAAYYLPDRAQVRNPWHLRALELAAQKRGARLRPGVAAIRFETDKDRITGVRTTEGLLPCGSVVIAAGAWSSQLLSELGLNAPTPPVKGQIVLLRGARPLLRRIVEHGSCYLVPREDGRVLVGATEEHVGFDTRTTSQGVMSLLQEALELCPVLAEAEVEKAWAGLRPGSLDTRPYVGPLPNLVNAFVATGHKRAGLQLSPATAEVVTDLVLGRSPQVDLSSYRIDREISPPDAEVFRS